MTNKCTSSGGDVSKCDNDGVSPIYLAAEKGHAHCLQLLLGAGADPGTMDATSKWWSSGSGAGCGTC